MRGPAAVNGVQQTGQARVSAGMGAGSFAEVAGVGLVGAQPVGGSVDADHGGAVQEPVEHGGGDGGVAERAGPVGDADVGRQDRAGLEVSLVDHLEQGGGAVGGQRQVAEFVDDQQAGPAEEPHDRGPAAFDGGLVAFGGQVGGGGEVDPVPGLGRGASQRD